MAELAAISALAGDDTPGGLEPGIADMLRNMDPTLTEGSVQGDEIEFEGFMFNQGTPAPLPVMPMMDAAAMSKLPQDMGPAFDPEPYANVPQVEETHEYGDLEGDEFGQPSSLASIVGNAPGSLPFWLQDRSQSPQVEQPLQTQPSWSAQDTSTPDSVPGNDEFADLPPIDPFDFSMVSSGEDEVPFGFNTDELIGLLPGGRDPMVVTANLEALADLMSGPGGPLMDAKAGRQGEPDPFAEPAAESSPAQPDDMPTPVMQAQFSDPEPQIVPVEPVQHIEDDATPDESKPAGWMATVTTGLTMDTISSLTGNLENSSSNAEMVVEDLDVAPFDYAQLDLDVEEESPTSNLMSGTLQGERTSQLEAMLGQMAEGKTSGPPANKSVTEAESDTSFIGQPPAVEEADMPTGYLREEARPESEPSGVAASDTPERSGPLQPFNTADMASLGDGVPEVAMDGAAITAEAAAPAEPSGFAQAPDMVDEAAQQEPTFFKARVASGAWGDAPAPAPAVTTEPQTMSAPEAEKAPEPPTSESAPEYGAGVRKAARTKVLNPDVAARTAGSQVQFEQDYTPKMPTPGDITTSGPLPTLDGFEDLNAWIERYPQDMGAHMALASAYTQAGDIDTALRVYRRMLRKPNVSENVLRMVQDELADLEAQAQHYPRYHQVRGDLLVRQGHRREAIEEYNKLG
jgi:pentatricopeptide repeat protein